MDAKALLMGDFTISARIMASESPAEMKQLGRTVANYDDEKWAGARNHVLYEATLQKFRANRLLASRLLGTNDAILAESSCDLIYGTGIPVGEPDANTPNKWKGQNLLGNTLMAVRTILLKELDESENVHVVNTTSPYPYNLNKWMPAERDNVEMYLYNLSAAYRASPIKLHWGNIKDFLMVKGGIVVDSAGTETFLDIDSWEKSQRS